ncbi:MAG: energy transducer TonB [Acidobacteriia bacterium]|nr:energy transducer TonB [Terriglobia bacterium]
MPDAFTLPTLPDFTSNGHGLYPTSPRNFMLGFVVEAIAVGVLMLAAAYVGKGHLPGPRLRAAIDNIGAITFPSSWERGSGHGGGGDQDKLAASRGALPKLTLDDQLTPPEAVLRNLNPKLPEPPSLMALSAVRLSQLGQLGDPLSPVPGPASNGPGSGSGIGEGCCGGVGPKSGHGFGPYDAGRVFRPGSGGVTAPRVVYDPEPEYSDAARKVKYQGSVILWLIVGPDGRPHNIRVQRTLGMGLDERAIEAVSKWRFAPSTLNGQPVAVEINVEVSFRLY